MSCNQAISYSRERVFIGQQFIFVKADPEHPVALKVDDAVEIYRTATILSRHRHAVGFGDGPAQNLEQGRVWPEPDYLQLPGPSLELRALVTDRKIYRPGTEAALFIVAPDTADREASLEIRLAGQKIYEAKVTLNREGLALHSYTDLKEGEYTAIVGLSDGTQAECTFSVAEFTLSPLIATLETHRYADRHLTFTLKLLLLSEPYSGPVEFGLQCHVCDERVVATQKVEAKNGLAEGGFDLSSHGGPFHVQVTTPDGHTALISFPGTGAREREHLLINPLGQTMEAGLLPWGNAQPVRGFYIGPDEIRGTPLMLKSVHAARGELQVAAEMSLAQIVTFNPCAGTNQVINRTSLRRGETIEFDTDAPYTLFTVGAFIQDNPFEGWGIVIKPVAFEATLTTPEAARPGEEIPVHIALRSSLSDAVPASAFCWLLVYDARLEHESPVPKLAKGIYESIQDATYNLADGFVSNVRDFISWGLRPGPRRRPTFVSNVRDFISSGLLEETDQYTLMAHLLSLQADTDRIADTEMPEMVVAPIRMEFPELAYLELFSIEGPATRRVKLGDQIGTWRVRAYIFKGVDYCELTSDIRVDKPLYAELDLPAIASSGDAILAAVRYHTREPADLVIATPFERTQTRVQGSGMERVAIKGPGRVEVRLENQAGSDWSVRDVVSPGVQKVTASRLVILDRGQTARGERVVVYPSVGQVLKDTITALIHYPFG